MAKFVELHHLEKLGGQPILVNFDLVLRVEGAMPSGGSMLFFASGNEHERLSVQETFELVAAKIGALRA